MAFFLVNLLKNNIVLIFFFAVLVLVSVCYLKVSTSQERAVADAFLFLVISALLSIAAANSKATSSITHFEFICLVFILYLVLKNLFSNPFDISLISYLFFLSILYFGLKTFFFKNKTSLFSIFVFATTINLFIYIVFAAYSFYSDTDSITNQYLQNKSIFGILLASQIVLLVPLSLYFKKNKLSLGFVSLILLSVIALSVVLLGLTNGRSGWLGFSLALIYIIYHNLGNQRFKKAILIFALPTGILLLALLFWYKPGSSYGRLLIYKVSAGMLKNNWLFGIGSGRFKVQYNQSQAAYFAMHNINSKEAMLADNTFYTFNDLFQVIIENGLIGFLFLLAIIFVFIKQIKKTSIKSEDRH